MDERTSHSRLPAGRRPLFLALGAVAAGLWLGQSTVSAIDPFYRSGAGADGGSYTVNGWEGANAIPAPESKPERYAANPYVFPAVVIQRPVAREPSPGWPSPGWDDEPLPAREEMPADDQPSEWGDYECVDCGGPATSDGIDDRDASWDEQVIAARDCADAWSRSSDCRDWPEDGASGQAEF